MLILTRKKDEQIVINDNIKITIVECSGDHVKIGIDAPRDVKIFRYEVYKAIEEENRKALGGQIGQLPKVVIKKKPSDDKK